MTVQLKPVPVAVLVEVVPLGMEKESPCGITPRKFVELCVEVGVGEG